MMSRIGGQKIVLIVGRNINPGYFHSETEAHFAVVQKLYIHSDLTSIIQSNSSGYCLAQKYPPYHPLKRLLSYSRRINSILNFLRWDHFKSSGKLFLFPMKLCNMRKVSVFLSSVLCFTLELWLDWNGNKDQQNRAAQNLTKFSRYFADTYLQGNGKEWNKSVPKREVISFQHDKIAPIEFPAEDVQRAESNGWVDGETMKATSCFVFQCLPMRWLTDAQSFTSVFPPH